MNEKMVTGQVALIEDDYTLVINRGAESGVTLGMVFAVQSCTGAVITDPECRCPAKRAIVSAGAAGGRRRLGVGRDQPGCRLNARGAKLLTSRARSVRLAVPALQLAR